MQAINRSFISSRLRLLTLLTFLVLFVVACGSSGGATPQASPTSTVAITGDATLPALGATATPAETPTPEPTLVVPEVSPVIGSSEPDGQRILEALKVFSDTIGPRVAGTGQEKTAAGLIADWLTQMGYDVNLQQFSIGAEVGRSSDLSIDAPDAQTVPTLPFANSAASTVSADLVYAGVGRPEDFPAASRGAIVLVDRDGVIYFNDKVANAIAAGAIGVVIANNVDGILYGSLDASVPVPVVGISMAKGQELKAAIDAGKVSATVSVGSVSDATSYNVVATPPGQECETVTGGHYDSVQAAPGASDNASGTATVLEIAAVLAHNGEMGSNCFVLFGAEELGLLGSAHYVSLLTPEEKSHLKAMINLDMVGYGDQAWWLIGDSDLQQRTIALAKDLGINDAVPAELIRGLSSDHASFRNAGIPVLMFHRWEDTLLHTPQDVSDRINPQYLEEAARMALALLHSLNTEG